MINKLKDKVDAKFVMALLTLSITFIFSYINKQVTNKSVDYISFLLSFISSTIILYYVLKSIRSFTEKSKQKQLAIGVIIFTTMVSIFFSINIILSVDSVWYYSYVDFFEGRASFSDWHPIRGPLFPFLLHISSKLFGYTYTGTAIFSFILYVITGYYLFKLVKELELNKKINEDTLYCFIIIGILLNPIFLGYYHLVLTEMVLSTFSIISLYYIIKTHNKMTKSKEEKIISKNIILRTVFISIFTVCSYSVKQFGLAVTIFPFITSEIILIINNKKWKDKVKRTGVLLLSFIIIGLTFTGYKSMWNKVTLSENAISESSALRIDRRIKNGVRYFELEDIDRMGNQKVRVSNRNGETQVFDFNNEASIKNTAQYLAACFVNAPDRFVAGYIDNYLVISNIYEKTTRDIVPSRAPLNYRPVWNSADENQALACYNRFSRRGFNIYRDGMGLHNLEQFQTEDSYMFDQAVDTNKIIQLLYDTRLTSFFHFAYKLFSLLLPFAVILSIVQVFRGKGIFWEQVFIISFSVFLNMCALAFVGSNIDRYNFPFYINLFLIPLMLFSNNRTTIKSLKEKVKRNECNYNNSSLQ